MVVTPVSFCAVCDRENVRRQGSFFCSDRCANTGRLMAQRANPKPTEKPETVGQWRAFYRRYANKGEIAAYGVNP